MSDKQPRDYTSYQQKVIKRYYDNREQLSHQQLAELVAELYLAEGKKKKQQLWERAGELMKRLGVPEARVQHLLQKGDPALVAHLVKELEAKS